MLKKAGIVTVVSSAFIFGGAFQSPEAETTGDLQNDSDKVFTNVNGEQGSIASDERKELLSEKNISIPDYNSDKNEASDSDRQQGNEEQEMPETKQSEEPQQQDSEQTSKDEQQEGQQTQQENQSQEQSDIGEFESQVVELTNQERANHGLEPLEIDPQLSEVAEAKSNDMAENGYFSHNSPTYGSPFDMMHSFGVDYQTAGENIARGQSTAQQVVDGWMNSPGHRENILNPDFTHIGVGYDEDGNFWTQQFIGK